MLPSIIFDSIQRHAFNVLVVVCCLTGVYSSQAQSSFRPLQFRVLGNASPGYFLLDPQSNDSSAFLDHGGHWRHRFATSGSTNFQKHIDGSFTVFNENSFKRLNPNLEQIGTLSADGYKTDFHDVRIIPDGKYLVLGLEFKPTDMSAVVPGGRPDAIVLNLVIQERTLAGQTLWTWKSLDYIPVTDATEDVSMSQLMIDYIHGNSIWLDNDGNVLLSCRHLDEVIKINRSTGAVMWRLGGSKSKGNQFTWLNDATDAFTGFSHQHSIQRTASGDLLMFDNGNLRQDFASRAVIYRLNEAAKTVERIWQYERPGPVTSTSMGSVEELPNGNILIGWGNNSSGLVLSEVTRAGELVAEVLAEQGFPFASYRVSKVQYIMAGHQQTIVKSVVAEFGSGSDATGVSVNVASLTGPVSVTIERHRNYAFVTQIPNPQPCRYFPVRWSVRSDAKATVVGAMSFSFANMPWLTDVVGVRLFRRDVEGNGPWQAVAGTFDEGLQTFRTVAFATGEYIAASDVCLTPLLIDPLNGQDRVPLVTKLAWTPAQNQFGYHIEVSSNAGFSASNIVFRDTTSDEFTETHSLSSLATYYWRVRAVRTSGPGDWSAVSTFKTTIDVPRIVRPSLAGGDTVAFIPTSGFLWTSVQRADKYEYRIVSATDATTILYQNITASNTAAPTFLLPNTWYGWQVRSISDSIYSTWTSVMPFITAPDVPFLLAPRDSSVDLDIEGVTVAWRSTAGAALYDLRISLASNAVAVINRRVADTVIAMPRLLFDTSYAWAIRAIGKYGPGLWSHERTFTTVSRGTLPAAALVWPLPLDTLSTHNITLRWHQPRASKFVVYVHNSRMLDDEVWTTTTSEPSAVIPTGVLRSNVEYYWFVVSVDDDGNSSKSEVWSFTVSVPAPVIVGLFPVYPSNGAANVPIEGELVFGRDSRATAYRIQMMDESDAIVLSIVVADTTLEYTGLRRGKTYRWYVIGLRDGVPTDTGDVAVFRTAMPVTSVGDIEELHQNALVVTSRSISLANDVNIIGADVYNADGALVIRIKPGDVQLTTSFARGMYIVVIRFTSGTKARTFIAY